MDRLTESLVTITLAFVMGAFPTAYVLGRLLKGIDVRDAGSGNSGAVNAGRQLGKGLGVIVLLVDAGKGALALFIGQRLGAPDLALYGAAFLAVIGHNFTPFLKFRGGKGAATVLGISALMLWQITAITVAFGGIFFGITRRSVWSMAAVFILLNALTIGTSQSMGTIVLCLTLSFVVAGTHFLRQYPQLLPAIRQGDWRRFMSID